MFAKQGRLTELAAGAPAGDGLLSSIASLTISSMSPAFSISRVNERRSSDILPTFQGAHR